MKYLKLSAFLAIIIIAFSACGKKDKENPSNSIIGNWKGEKQIDKDFINGQLNSSDTTLITPPNYFNLSFKANNNFEADSEIDGDSEHQSGYYSVSGNQITLGASAADPDKENYTFTISGNSLVLFINDSETNNGVTYKYETTIYLTRK